MEIINENPQPKRLYRSRDGRIGGVCRGLAEYFNIDVVLIRVICFVLIFVPFMPIVIPYLIACLIIPLEP